jgi:hypothetical protein
VSEHENAPGRATGAIVPNHELSPRTYLIMCGSVRRAMDLMAELDSLATPVDRERVQHGVSHELESLARVLDLPHTRGRHADVTILDDSPVRSSEAVPLPFEEWPAALQQTEGLAEVKRPPDYGREVPPVL